jgi:hypothetical protein
MVAAGNIAPCRVMAVGVIGDVGWGPIAADIEATDGCAHRQSIERYIPTRAARA